MSTPTIKERFEHLLGGGVIRVHWKTRVHDYRLSEQGYIERQHPDLPGDWIAVLKCGDLLSRTRKITLLPLPRTTYDVKDAPIAKDRVCMDKSFEWWTIRFADEVAVLLVNQDGHTRSYPRRNWSSINLHTAEPYQDELIQQGLLQEDENTRENSDG